jgi:hypothetical protein
MISASCGGLVSFYVPPKGKARKDLLFSRI